MKGVHACQNSANYSNCVTFTWGGMFEDHNLNWSLMHRWDSAMIYQKSCFVHSYVKVDVTSYGS